MIHDLFRETVSALTSNKVRSGLTILGIVIGIASVIAMVSIGTGAKNSIQASIEGLGSNLLTVTPGVVQPGRGFVSSGRGAAQSLTLDDANALAGLQDVAAVSPEIQRRFQIISQTGNNTNITVIGARSAYEKVRNISVGKGSFITEAHDLRLSRVAVLGPTTAEDLFGTTDDALGKNIRINRITFKVVGILTTKGGSGFFNPDDIAIVPFSTMEKILAGTEYLSTLSLTVGHKEKMAEVKDAATALLLSRHKTPEPDFSIISQADILGTLTQVTTSFTMFLASIAGISLIVGGIGIMNMMLTAVTERTREIGLRKAIGARERNITMQFLAEAVMLTLIGGLVGILLGWIVAVVISGVAGIATTVSLESIMMACGVSGTIGIVFGYYPALRASRLNPIEALRYE